MRGGVWTYSAVLMPVGSHTPFTAGGLDARGPLVHAHFVVPAHVCIFQAQAPGGWIASSLITALAPKRSAKKFVFLSSADDVAGRLGEEIAPCIRSMRRTNLGKPHVAWAGGAVHDLPLRFSAGATEPA